jgi:hypothetical protein
MFVFFATLFAGVILRSIQLGTNMDFTTGKYIDGDLAFNYTAVCLVVGFLLIVAVMTLGSAKDKIIEDCVLINPMRMRYEKLTKKISNVAAYAMFFTALTIVVEMYMQLSAKAAENEANYVPPEVISREWSWPDFPLRGIPVMKWLVYVFMVVMIITLISAGVNIIKGIGITKGNCFFFVSYPLWKLLDIFVIMGDNEIIGVYSEKVYLLLNAIAASTFVLFMVRLFSGFEKKHTRLLFAITGYIAAVLAGVSVIPRFIMLFVTEYSERGNMTFPDLSDLGMGFVAVSVIAVFWSKFEYRPAPKLVLKGTSSGAWKAATAVQEMEELDYDTVKPDTTQGKLD